MKSSLVLCSLWGLVVACGQPAAPLAPRDRAEPDAPSIELLEKGREASPQAIASLLPLLSSAAADERREAAYALGVGVNMGASAAPIASALIEAAPTERDDDVSAAILWALGRAGDDKALPTLTEALASPVASRVAAAGLALAVLGRREIALDDEARAALLTASSSSDAATRFAITVALAREHEPPVDAAVIRTLEALSLDSAAETRAAALVGLTRRERGVDRLASALADDDWRVVVEAIRGLLAIKGPRAMSALEGWARTSVAGTLRPHPLRVALEGLAPLADKSVAQRIAGLLLVRYSGNDLDHDGAQIACLAEAVRLRGGGDVAALRACGGAAVSPWWRAGVIATAVAASSHMPRSQRVRALAELAVSKDARIRAAAITPLAELSGGAERAAILDIYRAALSDASVAVAGSAADQLAALALTPEESGPMQAALVARADKELAGDGELGLTLVAAIAKNRIEAGAAACEVAARHRNRTIAGAGRDCLEALGKTVPAAGSTTATARAAAPTDLPRAAWWRIKTSRGDVVVELEPGVAPRHVAAVIKLTGEKFYDGLGFHRVVANFVIQGGDPDGTGWGGPDFVIPAEPSHLPFDRGAVGIADAGPDTGGSQWFVMHSRAPRLEGRYTRIGHVVAGMNVVDAIAVGDRIVAATIELSPPTDLELLLR